MMFIRLGDKKKEKVNIVDELKDFINRMCVTDDVEELRNMKKWSIYCIEKIYDFNYKKITKNT